jgi:hypothetical protein
LCLEGATWIRDQHASDDHGGAAGLPHARMLPLKNGDAWTTRELCCRWPQAAWQCRIPGARYSRLVPPKCAWQHRQTALPKGSRRKAPFWRSWEPPSLDYHYTRFAPVRRQP